MSLGKNVKHLRDLRGWDQKRLSKESGVAVGTISAIEVRNSVRSQFAPQLAAAFGVTVESLVGDLTHITSESNVAEIESRAKVPVILKGYAHLA